MPTTPHEAFTVTALPDRSEVAVVPAGELDLATVDALDHEVRELRRSGFDKVVVDLRRVTFVDSSGLRLMLSLRSDARRDGHELKVVPGPPQVQRVFDLTATRHLFDWRDY